jgi:hypothetical protein
MAGYGTVCIWQESGLRQSVLCWCDGRNLASVAMKMFSHLIYFIKKFYTFCTFNMICKDNLHHQQQQLQGRPKRSVPFT